MIYLIKLKKIIAFIIYHLSDEPSACVSPSVSARSESEIINQKHLNNQMKKKCVKWILNQHHYHHQNARVMLILQSLIVVDVNAGFKRKKSLVTKYTNAFIDPKNLALQEEFVLFCLQKVKFAHNEMTF